MIAKKNKISKSKFESLGKLSTESSITRKKSWYFHSCLRLDFHVPKPKSCFSHITFIRGKNKKDIL